MELDKIQYVFEVSSMKQVEIIHMKLRGKNTSDVLQSRINEALARLPLSEVISVFTPAIGAISAVIQYESSE